MSGDEDLFGKAMQDVRRIETEPRRVVEKSKPRFRQDVHTGQVQSAAYSAPAHRPVKSAEPWTLKADGVSAERLRQLGAGRPAIDAETDLHGMTREGMYGALSQLMEQALESGWRVLSLVHGRGLHSEDGRAILKDAVYEWLRDGPYAGWVLAAIPKPGTGGGSALVLLRRRR
jgi:DNA-nicking Smr family endonuclease